jgi:hypothetical protein
MFTGQAGRVNASALCLARFVSIGASRRLDSSSILDLKPRHARGFLLLSVRRRLGIGPHHARIGCETPPSSSGSRRAVSPDTCLLALGRSEGFDVARLCHLVRKLRPALAE